MQLVSQTTPFVECAAGGGADPAPFVIASLAPGLSVEDTSIGPLRERLPRNEAATLVVLAGADAAGRGARAVETIVGYFRLAEPFASAGAPRSVVTSIPGLRGGLRQALELGRDRTVRESPDSEGDLDLVVAYCAFPRLYLATLGRVGCALLRGGQLASLGFGGGENAASSRQQLRTLLDRALGREMAEATHVRRVALRRGDRLALSTDGVGRPELAPSVAAILTDAADPRAAARALQDLIPREEPATVVVMQVR